MYGPFLDMLCLLTDHPMSDEIDEFLTAPVVIAIDRVNKETYKCTSMVEGNIYHIFHPAEIHHFTGFKPQVYHYPNLAKMACDYYPYLYLHQVHQLNVLLVQGVDLVVPAHCSLLDETIRFGHGIVKVRFVLPSLRTLM